MRRRFSTILLPSIFLIIAEATYSEPTSKTDIPQWEISNPLRPLPTAPLGIGTNAELFARLEALSLSPTSESVRLGRWLFFDTRLSADNTVSCASCHQPEHAFSAPTPVSKGIDGQKGTRKSPSIVNHIWNNQPYLFWDGRASSLEEQALSPMSNPSEMGNKNHQVIVEKLTAIHSYKQYFKEAFGSEMITIDRITKAIADYQRTRMSGNSAWDKWRAGDEHAVSAEIRHGHRLFFGEAECDQCHQGQNFTDGIFHNLGIGWSEETKTFADLGRYEVIEQENNRGAFKTPSLRDVSKRAPYMHDGSIKTLREVIELYSGGGIANPYLDRRITHRFNIKQEFNEDEIAALVEFLKALDGEGYQDTAPTAFPE